MFGAPTKKEQVVVEVTLAGASELSAYMFALGPHMPYVEFIFGDQVFVSQPAQDANLLNDVTHIIVELPKETAGEKRERLLKGLFEDEATQMLVRLRETARLFGEDPVIGEMYIGLRGVQDAGVGVGRHHPYVLVLDGQQTGVLDMRVRTIQFAASQRGVSSFDASVPTAHTMKITLAGMHNLKVPLGALGLPFARPYVEFVYGGDVWRTNAVANAAELLSMDEEVCINLELPVSTDGGKEGARPAVDMIVRVKGTAIVPINLGVIGVPIGVDPTLGTTSLSLTAGNHCVETRSYKLSAGGMPAGAIRLGYRVWKARTSSRSLINTSPTPGSPGSKSPRTSLISTSPTPGSWAPDTKSPRARELSL